MELTRPVVKVIGRGGSVGAESGNTFTHYSYNYVYNQEDKGESVTVMPLGNLNFKKVIFRNYANHAETVSGKLVDFLLVQQIVQFPMQPTTQRSKNTPRHKNLCKKKS